MLIANGLEVEMVHEVGEDHQDSVAYGSQPEDDEFRVVLGSLANPGMREWLLMVVVDGDIVAADDRQDPEGAGEEGQEGG